MCPSGSQDSSNQDPTPRFPSQRIHEAAMKHGYTLTAISKYLGLHPSTLSRIVKQAEKAAADAGNKV